MKFDPKKTWWDDNQEELISAVAKMDPDHRVSVLMDAGMDRDEAEMECEGTPRHIAMCLWSVAEIGDLEEICRTFSAPVDERRVLGFQAFMESKSEESLFDRRMRELEELGWVQTRVGMSNGKYSELFHRLESENEAEWQEFLKTCGVPILRTDWAIFFQDTVDGEPTGEDIWCIRPPEKGKTHTGLSFMEGQPANDAFIEAVETGDYTWLHPAHEPYAAQLKKDREEEDSIPEPEPF